MGEDLTARGPAPVVAEFLGLPGAGKSTVAHALASELRQRGVEVSEPTGETDRLPSGRARRLAKLRLAAAGALTGRGAPVQTARAILGSSQSDAAALPASLVNWLYLAGLYVRARSGSGVTLLDQGLLQAVWSIAFGAALPHRVAPESWVELVCPILPPGSIAVLVEADDATVRRRLAGRTGGMSRLDRARAGPEGEFGRALTRAHAALDVAERVAGRLSETGHLRLLRVESVSSSSDAVARTLVPEIIPS